jgi:hypothetical protein
MRGRLLGPVVPLNARSPAIYPKGRVVAEGDRGIDGGPSPGAIIDSGWGRCEGWWRCQHGPGLRAALRGWAFGAWRDHSHAGGTARTVLVTVPEGGHHGPTDHHVFTSRAVCGACCPAGFGAARIDVPYRDQGCAGARAARGAPGRAGFHRAVRVGVHEHQPAVRRAPAGHLALEGELARRDQAGAEQRQTRQLRAGPARRRGWTSEAIGAPASSSSPRVRRRVRAGGMLVPGSAFRAGPRPRPAGTDRRGFPDRRRR